jgi:hypothetical protein
MTDEIDRLAVFLLSLRQFLADPGLAEEARTNAHTRAVLARLADRMADAHFALADLANTPDTPA